MSGHDILIFGPVKAGDRTSGGKTYQHSGYGWACSCGEAQHGYQTEAEAEFGADIHLSDGGPR